jgi:hypothetical protein
LRRETTQNSAWAIGGSAAMLDVAGMDSNRRETRMKLRKID